MSLLYSPVTFGPYAFKNRVVMSPMTRSRALGKATLGRTSSWQALRSGGASRRHAPMSPASFAVRTENTCTPSPSRQTLSASVEESRAELACCPHLQPVISGMSSPCRQMYSLCSMSLSRIACFA
jgi:hypothetical protein